MSHRSNRGNNSKRSATSNKSNRRKLGEHINAKIHKAIGLSCDVRPAIKQSGKNKSLENEVIALNILSSNIPPRLNSSSIIKFLSSKSFIFIELLLINK